MTTLAGSEIVPIALPVLLRVQGKNLHAIAMSTDGNDMSYLTVGTSDMAAPPRWINESEIEASFIGALTTRSRA